MAMAATTAPPHHPKVRYREYCVAIIAPNRVIPYPTQSEIMTCDAVKNTRLISLPWRSDDGLSSIISSTASPRYMATNPANQACSRFCIRAKKKKGTSPINK